jgi:hypothetical protein
LLFKVKRVNGKRTSYRLVLDKVRHEVPAHMYIELEGNVVRMRNSFSGVYHQFENGETSWSLSERSLRNLIEKLERDFTIEDEGKDNFSRGSG